MCAEEEYTLNIREVVDEILTCCAPRRVILYGEKVTAGSRDLKSADLCIVLDQFDKRVLLNELYLKVDMPIPVQFLLYKTEDWNTMLRDSGSYAYAIEQKGTVLYGEKT